MDPRFYFGLAAMIFGSLVLIFLDETAPEMITRSYQLEQDLSATQTQLQNAFAEHDDTVDYYTAYQNHLLARITVNALVQDQIERAANEQAGTFQALEKHTKTILGIFAERRTTLFGIGEEYWNFSVYRYDDQKRKHVCVACKREDSEDENNSHREWSPGEGHIGLCYDRNSELIFENAMQEELLPVLSAQGRNMRDYDADRYLSLASIPISKLSEKPLGVLIATSSEAGRFKNDNERTENERDNEWENADTLRDAASSLAIIFQLIHVSKDPGGKNDDGDS